MPRLDLTAQEYDTLFDVLQDFQKEHPIQEAEEPVRNFLNSVTELSEKVNRTKNEGHRRITFEYIPESGFDIHEELCKAIHEQDERAWLLLQNHVVSIEDTK